MFPDPKYSLDNFILAGRPDSLICAQHFSTDLLVYQQLGLLLRTRKCDGPFTMLVTLGIHLST